MRGLSKNAWMNDTFANRALIACSAGLNVVAHAPPFGCKKVHGGRNFFIIFNQHCQVLDCNNSL